MDTEKDKNIYKEEVVKKKIYKECLCIIFGILLLNGKYIIDKVSLLITKFVLWQAQVGNRFFMNLFNSGGDIGNMSWVQRVGYNTMKLLPILGICLIVINIIKLVTSVKDYKDTINKND